MSIALTGATGQLGRLVIEDVRRRAPAADLVALARTPSKAAALGVTVRTADYDAPETLASALVGVHRLLLISGNEIGRRVRQHENVIAAARAAGVRHLIYTSILHADTSPLSLAQEHLATENLVRASGLPFTILRNGWYTENYLAALPSVLANGALIGSAGDGRISSAARADFAEAAAAVLTTDGHTNTVYELAGDEAHTLTDLAAEFARQTGTPIVYRDLPEAEYAATLAGVGRPADVAASIASWDVGASRGALFDEGRQLSALIGHPTTPLAVVVSEAVTPASSPNSAS